MMGQKNNSYFYCILTCLLERVNYFQIFIDYISSSRHCLFISFVDFFLIGLFVFFFFFQQTIKCYFAQSLSCVPTLFDPIIDCSLPGSSVRGDYPGKNTGVGGHALLQGTFPTQILNPGSRIAGRFFTREESFPSIPGKPSI